MFGQLMILLLAGGLSLHARPAAATEAATDYSTWHEVRWGPRGLPQSLINELLGKDAPALPIFDMASVRETADITPSEL